MKIAVSYVADIGERSERNLLRKQDNHYEKQINKIKHTIYLNLLSSSFTKWSNTLKQFVGKLPTNCLSVFDHFVGLVLKGLTVSLVI